MDRTPLHHKNQPVQKKQEEEGLQTKMENTLSPPQFKLDASADSGLPGGLQSQMENTIGADFSNVNIHENSSHAKEMGALAYTQGKDVHFAPGQFQPETQSGQELIGHELTHVKQQAEGRVQANTAFKGTPVNNDKSLEKEADDLGAKAAQAKMETTAQRKVVAAGEAGDGSAQMKPEKFDPLKVDRGQLTFDAEGNDSAKSRYFSRVIHWPGGASGVTIGRGYDLGHRSSKEVLAHMQAAGVPTSQAELLAKGAGLKGKSAGEWVKSNKNSVGEISHEAQKKLFEVVYTWYVKDVQRLSNKKDVAAKYGETDFENLHPAILDLLVDLRYRGDYHPRSRRWVQAVVADNDLKKLAAIMADPRWKTEYNVPKDRFERRKKFMQEAVAGKAGSLKGGDSSEKEKSDSSKSAATESSKPIGSGVITASALNVRSGPGAKNGKVGEPVKNGATVDIYAEKNGWYMIGEGQWVSGNHVKFSEAKKPEPPKSSGPIDAGTVTASALNVRTGPGGSFKKAGDQLRNGSAVQVFEKKDGWLRIGDGLWVSGKYVQLGGDSSAAEKEAPKADKKGSGGSAGPAAKPNWMTIAEGEMGQKEIAGSKHNSRIIEYHSTTGKFGTDEVPWCASFVNWVFKQAGIGATNSARALSFETWGKKLEKPAYGSVAVISWGGGKGHVGFVVGKKGSRVSMLGGNQSDSVKVSSFPESKIVAYVVPADYEVPAAAYNLDGVKAEDGGGLAATR